MSLYTTSSYPSSSGSSSPISRIQRGTVTILNGAQDGSATILEVDTAKSSLVYLGIMGRQPTSGMGSATITLTDEVTVTATRTNYDTSYDATVSFEVIEYV